MKAVIYTRFSTDQQQSTESQIQVCRAFAKKNDINVIAVFSDEGMSGTNIHRKGFSDLVYAAQNGLFECVIIYDISRGSRDVGDWFNFRKLMRQLNITVVSATQELGDIYNADDFLKELISVGIGQHQILQTRKKSIDGKTTQARQGLFQGGFAPLGYDIVNQQYVINDYEANAIRLIFARYAKGDSYGQIVDDLAKQGYKGKRGQTMGKNSLNNILKNDRYIGVYSWNRNLNRQMNEWVGLKDNPNKVELLNKIPRIIDDETWGKVRNRMRDNKSRAKNKAIEKYLLSGKVICDECHATYVGHTSTNSRGVRTRSYVCGNRYRTRTCKAPNFNADVLETEMVLQIKAWLLSLNLKEYAHSVALEFAKTQAVDKTELYNELKTLENKITRATKLLIEDSIDSVKDELLKMQTRKNEISSILSETPTQTMIDEADIVDTLKKDIDNIDNLDAETIFSRYIKEIHALNGELSVIGGVYSIGSPGRI